MKPDLEAARLAAVSALGRNGQKALARDVERADRRVLVPDRRQAGMREEEKPHRRGSEGGAGLEVV